MDSSVLTNLAGALRAYLAAQFASGSDQILAFESFGVPIDPDAFRSGPAGSFNPVLVNQHLNGLTNKIGQLAGGQFHGYMAATEVFGALLTGTVQDPNLLAAFGAVMSPAEQAFRGASPTFPTQAAPDNWYDTSATGNWTIGQSVTSDQFITSTGGGGPSPSPKPIGWLGAGGVTRVPDNWELRVAAPEDQPTLVALTQPAATVRFNPVVTTRTPLDAGPATRARFTSAAMLSQPMMAQRSALSETSAVATSNFVQPSVNASTTLESASGANLIQTNSASSRLFEDTNASMPVDRIMIDPDATRAVLGQVDTNASSHQVTSNSLSLSFDLCPVTVQRDWWSWLLVRTPGWTLPLWSAGQLVPGLSADNSPAPPCGLPSTMLVIKNLQISGWSDSDTQALQNASRVGPFSFVGTKHVVSGTVSAPGMQVIGWVCEQLPPLPPPATTPPATAATPPAAPATPPATATTPDPSQATPDPSQATLDPSQTPTTGTAQAAPDPSQVTQTTPSTTADPGQTAAPATAQATADTSQTIPPDPAQTAPDASPSSADASQTATATTTATPSPADPSQAGPAVTPQPSTGV